MFKHCCNISILFLTLQRLLILFKPAIKELYNQLFFILTIIFFLIILLVQFYAFLSINFSNKCLNYTCIATTNIFVQILFYIIPLINEILIFLFGFTFLIAYSMHNFSITQKVI